VRDCSADGLTNGDAVASSACSRGERDAERRALRPGLDEFGGPAVVFDESRDQIQAEAVVGGAPRRPLEQRLDLLLGHAAPVVLDVDGDRAVADAPANPDVGRVAVVVLDGVREHVPEHARQQRVGVDVHRLREVGLDDHVGVEVRELPGLLADDFGDVHALEVGAFFRRFEEDADVADDLGHLFALAAYRAAVLPAGRPRVVFVRQEFGVPRDDVRRVQHLVAQQAVEVVQEVPLGFEVFGADGAAFGIHRSLNRLRLRHADGDPDASADGARPPQPRHRHQQRLRGERRYQRDVHGQRGRDAGDRPQPDAAVARRLDGAPGEPAPGVRDARDERHHRQHPDGELVGERQHGRAPQFVGPQPHQHLHGDEQRERGGQRVEPPRHRAHGTGRQSSHPLR